MIKEYNGNFKNSAKCWICDNDYIHNDVKVRDHSYITGGSAHTDCNINLTLSHKIPIVSYNLKTYDSLFIMQELGRFNLEMNVTPNGLEKYMSFTINNKLTFIHSFQFVSFSLDNLGKNLNKNDFKYLSQEFDNNVLDLQVRTKYLRKTLVFM